MVAERDIGTLLAELESEHERLRVMLAGTDAALLARRPPSGRWSILENVQHLVFTGNGHLGNFVPERRDWSSLGFEQVEPWAEKQLRLRAGGSMDELLAAWRAGYESYVPALLAQDTPDVRHRVVRHTRHQTQHITEIERLLRRMR
jgi:hypothetical protein